MFFSPKFTLGMFQRSVRNFGPKIVRNEGKSVRKLNVRNYLQISSVTRARFLASREKLERKSLLVRIILHPLCARDLREN